MKDVFKETKRLLDSGQKAVLATVVKTKGSTPQKPGAKLLVREDGSVVYFSRFYSCPNSKCTTILKVN